MINERTIRVILGIVETARAIVVGKNPLPIVCEIRIARRVAGIACRISHKRMSISLRSPPKNPDRDPKKIPPRIPTSCEAKAIARE